MSEEAKKKDAEKKKDQEITSLNVDELNAEDLEDVAGGRLPIDEDCTGCHGIYDP